MTGQSDMRATASKADIQPVRFGLEAEVGSI